MQTLFKQEKDVVITPTIEYFIVKNLQKMKLGIDHKDLAALETLAENHIKNLHDQLNPADRYFFTKASPSGIIPPQMTAKILLNLEMQALEYVKPYISDYVEEQEALKNNFQTLYCS
jgi:hypothetical protein